MKSILQKTIRLATLFCLLLAGFAGIAQQGERVGIPTTGAMGITVSVAELQAKSILADQLPKPIRVREEFEARRRPRVNPDAPQAASWSPDAANRTVSPNTSNGISATQAIHSNFLGSVLSEAGSVPPDNMGDIGTTQVCVAANGRIKFYARNTVCATAQTTVTTTSNTPLGAPALNADLDVFFSSVTAAGVSDPHVRFDRQTSRWFVVAIDLLNTSNRCVIAVSSGPTVTSSANFTFFSFIFDALLPVPPSPYAGGFFDYPTLGVDANALYIGGRMFNGTGTAYTGASIFVVRKSSVLGAGPIVTTAFHQIGTTTTGIYTPQGVDNDDPTATQGYVIGVDQGVFSQLDIHRISTPGGTPTASAMIAITVPTTSLPLSQVNSLAGNTLDVNDDRVFAAMIRKNKITGVSSLWTTHAIAVTTAGTGANSGTGRRNGARWYQIGNLSTTPSLTQSGTLFDGAATNPRGFIFPSIAMSGQGHSVLGFTSASAVNFIDCGIAGRYRTDATGTIQPFTLATSASTTYAPGFDASPFRWGDYTQTVVDPLDDMTMWSFVQYCNAANSWGVRAVQLKAPPPATPTAPGTIGCGSIVSTNYVTPVTLNSTSVSNSEFFDPGTGYTNRLTVTTTGTGASISSLVFAGPTQLTFNVTWPPALAGTTQTLTITNPDCQSVTTTYTLPTGCTPIPVRWISFTGREQNKKAVLNWATANEYNNKYFIIEKSGSNNSGFAEIGRINSKNVNGDTYDFTDNDPAAVNYYRLKQVDNDGNFTYSDVVLVKITGKFKFTAYPNPASSRLTVEYNDAFRGGTVALLNSDGKKVLTQTASGFNKITLNVSNLAAGLYVVEIRAANGENQQQKILIERQ
jgi:Secretion system C-terminal sorting domain